MSLVRPSRRIHLLEALEGIRRRPQPLLLELYHLIGEAAPLLADDVVARDAHVLEGHL